MLFSVLQISKQATIDNSRYQFKIFTSLDDLATIRGNQWLTEIKKQGDLAYWKPILIDEETNEE